MRSQMAFSAGCPWLGAFCSVFHLPRLSNCLRSPSHSFDFGSNSQGFVTGGYAAPPIEQARHFASQGVTVFRIPFVWQRMTPELGGPIDESFFSEVDQVVQACLNARTRPHVILDLHK